MSDYIKQLERQNEELKERLAVAEELLPKFVDVDFENDQGEGRVVCQYLVGGKIFAFITYDPEDTGANYMCWHSMECESIYFDSLSDAKKSILKCFKKMCFKERK